jgi:hypothetical protein
MPCIRQSLDAVRAAADLWNGAGNASATLERLQAVGRDLGVARLLVSTEDGNAPLDVWCGPVSARARRPIPADAQPAAVSEGIYCRSGILALPLRASQGRAVDPCFTIRPAASGDGLSLSRSIVEVHGGSLSGGNRPAGGAEFVLTLPAGGDET